MAFGNDNISNSGNYEAFFKRYYDDDGISNTIFWENKLLGLLPKFEKSVGDYFVHTILFGAGQGASANFGSTQTVAALSGENAVQMLISLVEDFRDATVSSKVLSQGNGDRGSFVKPVVEITDSQLVDFANSKNIQLYRSQNGVRGQIGSLTTLVNANDTITLVNTKDALNFEVGMVVQCSTTTTGTSVTAMNTTTQLGLYLVAVNYVAGTLTVGNAPVPLGTGGVATVSVVDATYGVNATTTTILNQYLFRTGDKGAVMFGFQDWIVNGVLSGSDSFNNVNRSTNQVRLAGSYLNGTGAEESEVLETAIAQVGEVGGKLTHFMMPFKHFANLSKALGAKAQLSNDVVTAKIGYEGIKIVGSTGSVNCIPDRACPSTMIAGINRDSFQLNSVKKAIRVWDEDGKVWLRSPTASGMEIRFYSFAQLVCRKPVDNINISVSS